ncbi:MAG: CBS domain-containing protein [Nanoarchaeota archaeon]|nr:CBS domain-containing protein [Nanoarchaeota archaeon]MBU1854808.1 CBS domain-containing protein [Nanoarchaeota archaeon]
MIDEENYIIENSMNGLLFHADKNDSVHRLAHLLADYKADAIIIRENGVPIGIVTAGDVLMSVSRAGGDLTSLLAENIMTSPIISIDSHRYVDEVKAFMLNRGIRKLPVKRDNDIIGLVVDPEILSNSVLYKSD